MNWDHIAGATRQYWGRLTGDRAGVVAGLRQSSVGRSRAGDAIARQASEKQLAEWLERRHKADPIHK